MKRGEMRCDAQGSVGHHARRGGGERERGLRSGDGVGREGEGGGREGKGREGGVEEICVERGSAKQTFAQGDEATGQTRQ